MRKLKVPIIIIAVLFFVIGYIFVLTGFLKQEMYNQIATVVGGLASILSLLGLVSPSLKESDIKTIEVETLKSLAKTAEEIQKKEKELNSKQNDLTQLELQKQELEFLVRNASLNLFFKEQMERYYETLERQVSESKDISRTINDIKELDYKINELNIEIEKSPNTENILKIIEDARKYSRTSKEIKTPLEAIFNALIKVFK